MNYIIFDLEATCIKGNNSFQNEIIEIGAVKLNDKAEIVDFFDEFVRPVVNLELSDFCKELTTITQEDVVNAQTFNCVSEKFKQWIGKEPYVLCSWGFYDKRQLIKDCQLHLLDFDWVINHISLKHQFSEIFGIKKLLGMKKALSKLGIPHDGTHHRGIDDAKNIAKIFQELFGKWKFE